jgi:alkylation response protein AidB-like acyl-CoA dehydrogenase
LIYDAGVETDHVGIIDCQLWAEFRRCGLAMSPFPKDLGGVGRGEPGQHSDLCTIVRLLGSADLSVARIVEGDVNAVSIVARYGNHDQLQALSERIAKGGLSAVWGADDAEGLHVANRSKVDTARQENFCFPRRLCHRPNCHSEG